MALTKGQASRLLWGMHWVMVTCFVVLFVVGLYMVDLPRGTAIKPTLFNFHKSTGVLVLGLLSVRIFLLLRSAFPIRWPQKTMLWLKTIMLHTTLYTFMLGVPISGYFLSNSFGREVAFFGLGLPTFFPANDAMGEFGEDLHFWLAYIFLSFIAAHILVQYRYILGRWRKIFGGKKKIESP